MSAAIGGLRVRKIQLWSGAVKRRSCGATACGTTPGIALSGMGAMLRNDKETSRRLLLTHRAAELTLEELVYDGFELELEP